MTSKVINSHTVNAFANNSIACVIAGWNMIISGCATAVYPSADLAIYIPFRTRFPFVVAQAFWYNGTLGTPGNVDVGMYTRDGRRLWSTGSTAQSGASALQTVDITDKYYGAGSYYIALACDNAAAQLFSLAFGNVALDTYAGIKQQATAFPLPATATFADPTFDYCPVFGFTPRGTI